MDLLVIVRDQARPRRVISTWLSVPVVPLVEPDTGVFGVGIVVVQCTPGGQGSVPVPGEDAVGVCEPVACAVEATGNARYARPRTAAKDVLRRVF